MNPLPNSDNHVTAMTATRPHLCPKCLGEGKISKLPSRKARLRHKRKIEVIKETSGGNTANKLASIQPLKRRLDPCTHCFQQSGLIWTEEKSLESGNKVSTATNSTNLHVAIIGGGIGGLALATALLQRGISCQVFEKDSSFQERSQGYGLTLQQARRALLALGIRDHSAAGGSRNEDENMSKEMKDFLKGDAVTSTKHVVHTTDGAVIGEWGLRKWGRPGNSTQDQGVDSCKGKKPTKRQNLHVPRQTLRYALLEAFQQASEGQQSERIEDHAANASVPIEWGHELIGIQPVSASSHHNAVSKMRLSFHIKEDNNSNQAKAVTKEADLVVGCDGIRSSVRQLLFNSGNVNDDIEKGILYKPLRYLGCIVILGICRLNLLHPSIRGASTLLDGETVFQTADGTTRIYLMPYSAKNEEYMWQLSFPISEKVAKEWSRKGPEALKRAALQKCESWHQPIPEILSKTPADLVSGYPVYDRDVLTADALAAARRDTSSVVTLLGDACHPMSPFKGQGANQALLDALSLSRLIYRMHCCENQSLEKALQCFEEEMIERSSKKVQASSDAARFLHSDIAITSGNVTRGAAAAIADSNMGNPSTLSSIPTM